jgi:hypothetical protein
VGLILVLIVGAAAWWVWRHSDLLGAANVIEYRGQKIKLSKSYYDFSDYKNDPDNIHPSETARVQGLVMSAPIAHSFSSWLDLFRATGDIQFPGYGAGSGGSPQPDGSELLAITIEIPRADKDRYIVFRGFQGHYELIDDFVNAQVPYPFGIREQDGAYVYYYTPELKELFRRPRR